MTRADSRAGKDANVCVPKRFIVFREFRFLCTRRRAYVFFAFYGNFVCVVVCARLFLEVVFNCLYRLVLLEVAFAVWFVVLRIFLPNFFFFRFSRK